MRTYLVNMAPTPPLLNGDWNDAAWEKAPIAEVDSFHARGSSHRPVTRARVLFDDERLHVIFRVEDRYVRSVVTERNGPVCGDSCVEFFVSPRSLNGYFNFEINAGGVLHCSYIDRVSGDRPERTVRFITDAEADSVGIYHSLPDSVHPELTDPIVWIIQFAIPFALLERYVGPIRPVAGQSWRANFYKCGDKTSHPHWGMWAPVEKLNFHQPDCFGTITFDARGLETAVPAAKADDRVAHPRHNLLYSCVHPNRHISRRKEGP